MQSLAPVVLLLLLRDNPAPLACLQDLESLFQGFNSDDIKVRDRAAVKLRELGKVALPRLEALSSGTDLDLALRARSLKGLISTDLVFTSQFKSSFPKIPDRLASGSAHAWTELAIDLISKGDLEGICSADLAVIAPRALEGTRDKWEIQYLVGGFRDSRVSGITDLLMGYLADETPEVRAESLLALAEMDCFDVTSHALRFLSHPDLAVRRSAAFALVLLDAKSVVIDVLNSMNKDPPYVVEWNSWLLGKLGALEAKERLMELAVSADLEGRRSAIRALGQLQDPSAIDVLLPLVDDVNVCADVATSLADLGAKTAFPRIASQLRASPPITRGRLLVALSRLDPEQAKSELIAFLETHRDPSDIDRVVTMELLADLRAVQAGKILDGLAKAEDALTRYHAVYALGAIGSEEAQAVVIKALDDPSALVRSGAIRSIGKMKIASLENKIGGIVKSWADRIDSTPAGDEETILLGAIDAIVELERASSVTDLRRFLSSPSRTIRCKAAEALALLGSRYGLPVLLKECPSFFSLNRARSPKLWSRLCHQRVIPLRYGTRRQVLCDLAKQIGTRIAISTPQPTAIDQWLRERELDNSLFAETTALRGLQRAIVGAPFEVILEDCELRIIPRKEARGWWMKWNEK